MLTMTMTVKIAYEGMLEHGNPLITATQQDTKKKDCALTEDGSFDPSCRGVRVHACACACLHACAGTKSKNSSQLQLLTFWRATAAARPAMPAPTTRMVSFVFPNSAVPAAAMHAMPSLTILVSRTCFVQRCRFA